MMKRVEAQYRRACESLAGGVSSSTRVNRALGHAMLFERAAGCRLWDLDGNEYIDLLNGFGPDLLGHSPPFVVQAVEKQLHKGYEVGPTPPLAGRPKARLPVVLPLKVSLKVPLVPDTRPTQSINRLEA